MENEMETRGYIGVIRVIVPLLVDRIWVIWGSYFNIPKAIFYLLQGDYILRALMGEWGGSNIGIIMGRCRSY